MAFVHLSLHTEFSITDGLVRVEALAERAREMGFPAVAVTDLGNLFGMLKFYKACRAEGVKPIVGLELEVREEARSYRLIVLATIKAVTTICSSSHLVPTFGLRIEGRFKRSGSKS